MVGLTAMTICKTFREPGQVLKMPLILMDLFGISLVKQASMTLLKIMSQRRQNIVIQRQVWVLFYELWQQLSNSIIVY